MPKILIYKNLIFFFYAGDINERAHVHIASNKAFGEAAKIWFENGVELFDTGSLTDKEINHAVKIVSSNVNYLTTQWSNFTSGNKVKLKKINKI